jgi:uncharacterized protein (TIGR02246 family)
MYREGNDKKALNNLTTRIDAAWNNHDPKAFSDLFEETGDFIFHDGLILRGRAAIEEYYQEKFPLIRKTERHATRGNHVRLVRPDIAILDFEVELFSYVGNRREKDIRLKLLCTVVAAKESGQWLISAIRLMVPKKRDSS